MERDPRHGSRERGEVVSDPFQQLVYLGMPSRETWERTQARLAKAEAVINAVRESATNPYGEDWDIRGIKEALDEYDKENK